MIGQQAVGEPTFLPQHNTSRSSSPLLGSQGIIPRRWIEENRTKPHAPSVHRFHGRNEEALLDIAAGFRPARLRLLLQELEILP
jgi:hypothetical protein